MNIMKWLTINSNGGARITASKPGLRWDEISILLKLAIPNELFQRPRLEANITLPESAAGPDVLTAGVVDNVKEAVEKATGLTFCIDVVKEEREE